MRVVLLYPPLQFRPQDVVKPDGGLGIPYIAGALRDAGMDVRVVDCAVGTADDDLRATFGQSTILPSGLRQVGLSHDRIVALVVDADVVGVTATFTMQTTPTLAMIRAIRTAYPAMPIIAGGVTARELRERFFAAGVTVICTSEAELIVVDLVERLRSGEDISGLPGVALPDGTVTVPEVTQNLDALPFPAWDLLPLERYWAISRPHGGDFEPGATVRYASMMTSRGCPFRCSFCHISKEDDGDVAGGIGAFRVKSLERVQEEFARLRDLGAEYVFIEDDSLLAKKGRAMAIFGMLPQFGLRLIDVNGVNIAHLYTREGGKLVVDRELLAWMAMAGFEKITLPFESGSQRLLDRWASRKWRVAEVNTCDLIRACREAGITPFGNYMLGYPDETFDEMLTTLQMAREHKAAGLGVASFFIVVPFPGSRLFDEAVALGEIGADFDPDTMNWTKGLFTRAPVSPESLEHIRTVAWHLVNDRAFTGSRVKMTAVAA